MNIYIQGYPQCPEQPIQVVSMGETLCLEQCNARDRSCPKLASSGLTLEAFMIALIRDRQVNVGDGCQAWCLGTMSHMHVTSAFDTSLRGSPHKLSSHALALQATSPLS